MDGKKRTNPIKTIISLFLKLLDILVKANYHEYPIVDKEGNIIGSEFVTTHEGLLIRPKIVTKDNDNIPSKCL